MFKYYGLTFLSDLKTLEVQDTLLRLVSLPFSPPPFFFFARLQEAPTIMVLGALQPKLWGDTNVTRMGIMGGWPKHHLQPCLLIERG